MPATRLPATADRAWPRFILFQLSGLALGAPALGTATAVFWRAAVVGIRIGKAAFDVAPAPLSRADDDDGSRTPMPNRHALITSSLGIAGPLGLPDLAGAASAQDGPAPWSPTRREPRVSVEAHVLTEGGAGLGPRYLASDRPGSRWPKLFDFWIKRTLGSAGTVPATT